MASAGTVLWAVLGVGATAALAALPAMTACAPADESACRPARRTDAGACCTGWLAPDGNVCSARTFDGPVQALGRPGARAVELAVDGRGGAIVTWVATDTTPNAIEIAQRDEDGAWATSAPAAGLPGDGIGPTVAADGQGRVLLTWKQQTTVDAAVYLATRDTQGRWTFPTADAPLSFPPTAYEPRPVFAPSGEAIVVWNQWTGTGYGVAVARRPSDEHDAPLQRPVERTDVLSPAINYSNAPQIAAAANGDALVVWYQSPNPVPGPGSELVVFASERTRESGTFSRPTRSAFISAPGAPVDSHAIRNPVVAVSPLGEATVVWTQENGADATPVFMAHRDGFARWSTPASLTDAFSAPVGRAESPQVAMGPGGETFVVWVQHRGDRGAGVRVLGAHRGADGTWNVAGDAPEEIGSPGADAVSPRLAVGPDGEALVVWQERLDTAWRVIARRRNAGADRWSEPTTVSPDDGFDATAPVAGIGPGGHALVAWLQGPPALPRVHVAAAD